MPPAPRRMANRVRDRGQKMSGKSVSAATAVLATVSRAATSSSSSPARAAAAAAASSSQPAAAGARSTRRSTVAAASKTAKVAHLRGLERPPTVCAALATVSAPARFFSCVPVTESASCRCTRRTGAHLRRRVAFVGSESFASRSCSSSGAVTSCRRVT